jgi:hypothetical protein
MRLVFLIIALVVPIVAALVTIGTRNGTLTRQLASVFQTSPVADFPPLLDLGNHEAGDRVERRFKISNRGGGELRIDDIRANCDCSGLERESQGRLFRVNTLRLGPGEETELIVRTIANGRPGDSSRQAIAFRTNDPTQPEGAIELLIPRVSGGFVASPISVMFGSCALGIPARRVVEIYDAASPARAVGDVVSSRPDRFIVRKLTVAAGEQTKTDVSMRRLVGALEIIASRESAGMLDGEVQVAIAGESRPPDRISVGGRVVAVAEVSPSTLVLPRRSSNGPIYSAQCVCRSVAGTALEVAVASASPDFAIEVSPVPRNRALQLVTISCKAGAQSDLTNPRRTVRLRARCGDRECLIDVAVQLNRETADAK